MHGKILYAACTELLMMTMMMMIMMMNHYLFETCRG